MKKDKILIFVVMLLISFCIYLLVLKRSGQVDYTKSSNFYSDGISCIPNNK